MRTYATILWKNFTELNVAHFFLVTTIVFGGINIFVTPPLQSPDADFHFLSALNFSHMTFTPYTSIDVAEFVDNQKDLYFHPERKYSLERLEHDSHYVYSGKKEVFFHFRLQRGLFYLPQIVGITVAKLFTNKLLLLMYAGRLVNLLAYASLIFLTIKSAPCFKWGFALLALMPVPLFLASTFSQDPIVISLGFLVISLGLKMMVGHKKLSNKHLIGFLLSALILSLLKFPYVLVACPFLLISQKKFLSYQTSYLFRALTLGIIGIGIIANPYFHEHRGYRPVNDKGKVMFLRDYSDNRVIVTDNVKRISKAARIKGLITTPQNFLGKLYNTVTSKMRIFLYVGSFIGCLGWLDTLLPPLLLVAYYLILFIQPFGELEDLAHVSKFNRLALLTTGIGFFLVIHVIFYIKDKGGFVDIDGVQGRYFIPFAPLLLLPFVSTLFRKGLKLSRGQINVVNVAAVLVLQTASVVAIARRYYFDYWWMREF